MRIPSTPLVAIALVFGAGVAACDSPTDAGPDDVERMRQASAAYADVQAALAAGFVPLSECVVGPTGAMGFHYGMPARLDDAVIDADAPEVMLYEPQADGTLRLVGVEFMMHQDAWTGAGNTEPPTMSGRAFDPPNPNHPDPMVRPFWTLHAWVWQENPDGMFVPFNPAVNCR